MSDTPRFYVTGGNGYPVDEEGACQAEFVVLDRADDHRVIARWEAAAEDEVACRRTRHKADVYAYGLNLEDSAA